LGFGNWWGPAWGYFTNAAGGGMFNADRTSCNLNSPESIAGAKYAADLYTQKLVPAGDADGEALFNAGKVGMYFNGRWFTPGVRTNAKFNWDVAEMPQGKQKSTWLFWGPYVVNAKTANAQAAWEVLKQLTNPDAMSKVAEMGTNIPSRKNQSAVDTFLKSNPPANNQAFIAGTEYAIAEQALWTGNWGDYSGAVQKLWDQLIAGDITAEQFGQQSCEQAAKAFNK
jgi:multiple sugar transport system substrate-binding protein